MSTTKHTPGPWAVGRIGPEAAWIAPAQPTSPGFVASLCTSESFFAGPLAVAEVEANANLIAAAPDLLAALKAIAESSGRYDDPEHDADPIEHALVMRDIALGAIAKAEGRS